jgi:hypothetical protein
MRAIELERVRERLLGVLDAIDDGRLTADALQRQEIKNAVGALTGIAERNPPRIGPTHGWTKARQQRLVGEGLAITCVDWGVAGVTRSPGALRAAFQRAWTSGPWPDRFPLVHDDLEAILEQSTRRTGEVMAVWYSRPDAYQPALKRWGLDRCRSRLAELTNTTYAEWVDLAEAFLTGLGEGSVHRAETG